MNRQEEETGFSDMEKPVSFRLKEFIQIGYLRVHSSGRKVTKETFWLPSHDLVGAESNQ